MEFRLLGPLEVVHGGLPLPIRAGRQRAVLAALLVDADRVVPLDVLIARVWNDDPPSRTALHNLVMRLRHALGADVIQTRADGYLIEVSDDELDVRRFDELVRRAKGTEDPRRASALLAEALALWRGEPLADVSSDRLQREVVPGLVERRLAAVEQRIEADLLLGRHTDLIPELRELTDRHPLREHFWHQRMRALHLAGRQAEALDCFRQVGEVLADELGVDPGPELSELHQRILDGDRTRARTPTVPHQLPTRTPHFVGRAAELRRLGGFLDLAAETVVISAVNGSAGLGKTALAVHWAHQAADRFPDGQLYVNLRGFDAANEPMHPGEAVRSFLTALDVPSERVPRTLDTQTALYRSLLADRRMIVLLDNARDADQVRPLLPASPSCLVLVTSRNQLTGLVAREGARPVPLDLLSDDDAVGLLRGHLGAGRVAAEPDAVAELVEHCAGVPLALSLMAARGAVNPRLSLRALTDDLHDEQTRLDALDDDDPTNGMRAVFSYSYRQLSAPAARLFRLLGSHPGPDVSVGAAASLAGSPVSETSRLLAELAAAHLVRTHMPSRFVLHDLLRVYAAEQPDAERRTAVHRMLDHYLHTAAATNSVLHGSRTMIELDPPLPGVHLEPFASAAEAALWSETEHRVLVTVISLAARQGFDRHAWQLPWAIAANLDHEGKWADWADTQLIALAAAERLGDLHAQERAHAALGHAFARLEDLDTARKHFTHVLALSESLGDQRTQAGAHNNLGWMAEQEGRFDIALDHARQALELYSALEDRNAQGRAHGAIGWDYAQLNELDLAMQHAEQALEVFRDGSDPRYLASSLDTIGFTHHRAGRYDLAVAHLRHALSVAHGDRFHESALLTHLGDALHAAGDPEGAREAWQKALALLEALGHANADDVRTRLRGS
ncbi:MAG: BTAD domain-containing putative transcriptional regulator [Umezawaea sp.]